MFLGKKLKFSNYYLWTTFFIRNYSLMFNLTKTWVVSFFIVTLKNSYIWITPIIYTTQLTQIDVVKIKIIFSSKKNNLIIYQHKFITSFHTIIVPFTRAGNIPNCVMRIKLTISFSKLPCFELHEPNISPNMSCSCNMIHSSSWYYV